METDQEKSSNDLLRKLIHDRGYDNPGEGFTDAVMKHLEKEVLVTDSTKYKSLIPARVWLLIGIGIVGIFWFMLSWDGAEALRINLFPYAERLNDLGLIQRFGEVNWNFLDNINIHNTVVYALLMLSFCLYIQFILLKKKLL